eukprot:1923396-Rhodomonas_salina.1
MQRWGIGAREARMRCREPVGSRNVPKSWSGDCLRAKARERIGFVSAVGSMVGWCHARSVFELLVVWIDKPCAPAAVSPPGRRDTA